MQFTMAHANLDVLGLPRSIAFYEEAPGLRVQRDKTADDGSFRIAFLADGRSGCCLELTWLRDKQTPYDLGDNESHICFVADDYEAAHAHHAQMGCICYENPKMGLYFINDPDGYWIEIVPERR